MPSLLHESHLLLFRNQPALAPSLIRDVLRVELPAYTEARVISGDLNDIQPAEYRADLVLQLSGGESVCGIIVEVQLSDPEQKRYAWPAYVVNLRARLRCPVHLLVVTVSDAVANRAACPIDLGGGNWFAPHVLRPSSIPEVLDEAEAHADPERAVLSAMAHGRDDSTERASRIAFVAQRASLALDEDRARMYFDLVQQSLSEAARNALTAMQPQKYEYQSDFARKYYGQGLAEGEAKLVARQLAHRFGVLPESAQGRIRVASIDELEAIGLRLLTATTLEEALGAASPTT
jgi:uncharacterized protein DUF4351